MNQSLSNFFKEVSRSFILSFWCLRLLPYFTSALFLRFITFDLTNQNRGKTLRRFSCTTDVFKKQTCDKCALAFTWCLLHDAKSFVSRCKIHCCSKNHLPLACWNIRLLLVAKITSCNTKFNVLQKSVVYIWKNHPWLAYIKPNVTSACK